MFGEATLAAPINGVVANVFMAPDDQKDDFTCGVIRDSMKKRLGVVSQRLARAPYVAGETFTLADISVDYAIGLAIEFPQLGLAEMITPDLAAYHQRLAERPAYQRMIAVK
jgi:glutathione S-transferase